MSQAAQYFMRAGQPIIGCATALGGPLAVLRLSGSGLKSRFFELFSVDLEPRKAHYSKVAGADNSVVLYFEGPNSFTGEDVIEIQAHGVPSILASIENAFLSKGAQKALPGEFSFRAVLNNKMTLVEAEALNTALSDNSLNVEWAKELVGVSKFAQVKSAELLGSAVSSLSKARGRVEASIDYPEAEAEQEEDVAAAAKILTDASNSLQRLMSSVENFSRGSKDESTLLILGEPNVGKSTLLNILSGGDRALVSAEAGTTRDYIDTTFRGPGGEKIRILDTAGLRFGADVGAVETAGVSRALDLISEVDGVILLSKATEALVALPQNIEAKIKALSLPVLKLYSHADRASSPVDASFDFVNKPEQVSNFVFDWLSKKEVFDSKKEKSMSNGFWVSKRQALLIEDAIENINEAMMSLTEQRPLELCGNSLTSSEKSLRAAMGEGLSEDYIGEIFSQFCLGK